MNWEEARGRISRVVDGMSGEIVEFSRSLIQIPTENPPGRNYRRCADLVGGKLGELGFQVEYVTVPAERLDELAPYGQGLERVSVVGRLPGRAHRPVLHFSGHMDVVPAGEGWTVDPYGGVVSGGRLYGRGASDQKSGIAAMVFAAEAVKRAGYRLLGTVESSATPDEETGGFAGLGYLVNQGYITREKTDYVVITECLDADRVCIGHRGTLWLAIETRGRKSHGSIPDQGVNALDKMVKLIHTLNQELKPILRKRTTNLQVTPDQCKRSTLAATVISSGTKVNTIPDSCVAEFDRRIVPGETVEGALKEIEDVCRRIKAEDPDFDYEIRKIMAADPTLVPSGTRVVEAFLHSGELVLGRRPSIVVSPGSDDQKFVVQEAGIQQCIIYGPGPLNLAHRNDEYVEIGDLLTSVKIMALAAMDLLGCEESKQPPGCTIRENQKSRI